VPPPLDTLQSDGKMSSMKRDCHKECEDNPYCWVEARSKFHLENQEKLTSLGVWEAGRFVHNHVALYYSGMAVHLYSNGTYYLEDTTGG